MEDTTKEQGIDSPSAFSKEPQRADASPAGSGQAASQGDGQLPPSTAETEPAGAPGPGAPHDFPSDPLHAV